MGADLYLQIDEGTGSTLTDSGTYNNGSITGGSWSDDDPYFTTVESVSLDGTDDYIQINNDSNSNLAGAITISYGSPLMIIMLMFYLVKHYGEFDLDSIFKRFVFYNGSPDEGEGYKPGHQ